jgi:hypothetical protein
MVQAEFTKEEIGERAVGNATGFCYGTISYLQSKGLSVEEWAEYVGQMHASGWEGVKGKGALVVLREAVINWISCGANLISLAGDENRAEAVLEWPPEWYQGVPFEEAHRINSIFIPITRFVDLKSAWESEGKQFRLTFFKE